MLLFLSLLIPGCAHPERNPLQGRNDEFDRRLEQSDKTPTWAYQNCRVYQREYFNVLHKARSGEININELRSFEWNYDQEIKKVER
jgi:hypothetical protein